MRIPCLPAFSRLLGRKSRRVVFSGITDSDLQRVIEDVTHFVPKNQDVDYIEIVSVETRQTVGNSVVKLDRLDSAGAVVVRISVGL